MGHDIWSLLWLVLMTFLFNVSACFYARARNRNNFTYHGIATIVSGTFWFYSFKPLMETGLDVYGFFCYSIGTLFGSLVGQRISLYIESRIMAFADPRKEANGGNSS